MNISWHDLEVLCKTVYGEARGESSNGRTGVVHVILNRAKDPRWPDIITKVCLQPYQFSCWNKGDPNLSQMNSFQPTTNLDLLDDVLMAVDEYLGDNVPAFDVTRGANHYHTSGVSPYWSAGHTPTIVIGRHMFFKL